MAKRDSTASTPDRGAFPKRGAFPTPRNILAEAKPFKPAEPDKSGLAGGCPSGGSDSQKDREQSNRGSKKKDS
jgi:hypothetical protein